MAPPKPTETRQTQRAEQVGVTMTDLQSSMTEEVTEAVNRAAAEMQQTLISQITTSLDQVTQKLQTRIDRVREYNETMISQVTRRQEEFQAEVRLTLSLLKTATIGATGYNNEATGLGSGTKLTDVGGLGFQGNNYYKDRDKAEDKGGGGNISNGGNWRYRKLDLPVFEGNNPDGWILRAERYFSFYRLNEEEKLEAAVVGLDGEALLWYQ